MRIKSTLLIFICALVAGCGNMGPLYLPPKDQEAAQNGVNDKQPSLKEKQDVKSKQQS